MGINVAPPLSYSSSEEEFFDAESTNGDKNESCLHDGCPDEVRAGNSKKSVGEPDYGDDGEDFDKVYDDTDEQDVGNVQQQHGSVLMHLLSQV